MEALSTYYKLRMANPQVQLSGETPAVQIPVEDENTSYSTSSGITDTHKGWVDAINGKNAVVIPEETPVVQPSVQTTNPNAYKAEQIAEAQRNITEQPRVVNQPQQPEKQRNYPSSSQSAAVQRTVSQTPVQKQPAQKMGGNPYVKANQQQQRYQIDTKDPINSLAAQLVTPAEREAMEMRLLRNKRKMIAWTGLFDGLRQLGNLYFTTKGATPQQFTDKPYQQIEADYQAELKRQDNLAKNRENYAKQLWNLKRQGVEDARKKALADAQVKWYDTRNEMARLKGENDRLRAENDRRKAEKDLELKEARQKQIETKTKQMEELHPLQKKKLLATIENIRHNTNLPYSSGKGSGGRGSSSEDPFKTLAEQLQNYPDVIGPILQQEGYGSYDSDKKEFNFSKNVTKGMATTATNRASRQIIQKKTGSLLPGNKSKKQKGSLLPK